MNRLLIITQAVDTNDKALGFFCRWIELLSEYYEKVTVICLRKGEASLPHNVEVISLGKESGTSRISQAVAFLRAIWTHRKVYDQVFVHMNPIYVVLGGWLLRLLKKRTVLWYTHRHVDMRLRIAVLFVDAVATVSPETMNIDTPKKHITGHGIDTRLYTASPNTQSPERLLVVGRITPIKRTLECVEAFARVHKTFPEATLSFIGEPVTESDRTYKEEVVRLADREGITPFITWHGGMNQRELISRYREYGTLLSLTQTGSFDKVILEAMLSGLLVCTPNAAFRGAIPEVCFIEPDTVAGAVETLSHLISLTQGEELATKEALIHYAKESHALPSLISKLTKLLGAS